MRASRFRQAIIITHPALNISRIPDPASIIRLIPHPAKPMLPPPYSFVQLINDVTNLLFAAPHRS